MAVTYRTSLKTTRMTDVVTDVGTSGKLVIGTTGMAATLCTITLSTTMGTVSNGVLTLSGTPLSGTASGTGTAAEAKITTSGGTDIITGLTVGAGSGNISLDSTSITNGQTVTINSGTITHG